MASEPAPRRPARCPICGRAAPAETRPFCSARCAQLDLGRWLTGGYAIPAGPETEPNNDEDDG